MLQCGALYVQKGDVLPFVLHTVTGLSDKWFLRYRRNRFEKQILKFLYNGLCTVQENLHLIFLVWDRKFTDI